jgi:hypothetical protein
MTPSEIASHVTQPVFDKVRSCLSRAFREGPARQAVDDAAVAAAIEAEWSARAASGSALPALSFVPAPPPGWSAAPAPSEQGTFQYYDTFGEHMRTAREKPHSVFVGLLPQVRVPLPLTAPADPLLAQTAIGSVFTSDHLLTSVAAVVQHMKVELPSASFADTTRVDLIAPARLGGRFGAIGLYLCYRNHAALPSYYILEAGLATGAPVRLYASPDMQMIPRAPTAYLPTPFVELSNTYDGTLRMNGNEPDELLVESYREPRDGLGPRIKVTVRYQPRTAASVTKLNPGDITLVAAERIAAIGAARGGSPVIELQSILAAAGNSLPWIKKP